MKKIAAIIYRTVKVTFIVLCVYLGSLFFREEHVPGSWVEALLRHVVSDPLVIHVDSLSYGFRRGIVLSGVRLYDSSCKDPLKALAGADEIAFNPFGRDLRAVRLFYSRLFDGYYEPGSTDRDEPVETEFPDIGRFHVTLVEPDVLGIRPARLVCDVDVAPRRIDFSSIVLDWPDGVGRSGVRGLCYLDLDRQEVYGEIEGTATTAQIRPLIVTLDVPVALPYMDAFTEVPEPCPSKCAWKVDLVRSDFDLWLDLRPKLGKYEGVPMKSASGKIHVHNCTRDDCLHYVTTVGPIVGTDTEGRYLDGTVVVVGTNRQNTVTVKAKSSQPLADVLRIGGFEGDYMDRDVIGETDCDLEFRFPRAMTNNYEVLNGRGHVTVKGGHLMRMKGFKGLIEAMPSIAPAVTWLSDSTQASFDYVIRNGVLKTDNAYIEGTCFSIKMEGWFDAVRNTQDFTVRVQFAKKDSLVGKILHPLTWPFTKLLLEFRLTGSPQDPKWKYVSVVDRVMEAVK